MINKKSIMVDSLCIIFGICTFISINISFALSKIQGFTNGIKAVIAAVPIILILAFFALLYLSSRKFNSIGSLARSSLGFTACTIVLGWLILTGCIFFFNYDVLYTNSTVRQTLSDEIEGRNDIEKISITAADGIILEGYLYKPYPGDKSPLVIYFGGRGEEASSIIEYASKSSGYSLAFINYRGCGLSKGSQSEKTMMSDALNIYDYFSSRNDIDENSIALAAHSLGTGVAVELASKRSVRGVALSGAYDTYTSGVIQDKFPLIPVGLLSKDEFNSLSIAPKLNIPALFLMAENDKTVLRSRSMRLLNSWGGKTQSVIIKGTHHENITLSDSAWECINTFFDGLFYNGI